MDEIRFRQLHQDLVELRDDHLPRFVQDHYRQFQLNQYLDHIEIADRFIEWAHSFAEGGLDGVRVALDRYFQIYPTALQPKPPTTPHNLQIASLNALLFGRQRELRDLAQGFGIPRTPENSTAALKRQVIAATGGIGKTRLAVEYAWRNAQDYSALWFVQAYSPTGFEESLAGLAVKLDPKFDPAAKADERIAFVNHWFATHESWLLIIDNLDDPPMQEAIERWFAQLGQFPSGHVLITSRLSDWTPEYQVHELKKLREDDSIDFLLLSTEIRRHHQPDDDQTARAIARELDGHCLALTQAVGYVNARRIRLTEFLDSFRNNVAKARHYADSLALRASIDRQEARSITTTFFTTFEKLTPATRAWLKAFAWLAPEPIPDTFCKEFATLIADDDWKEKTSELRLYCLLDGVQTSFDSAGQMHRLVQMVVRDRLPEVARTQTRQTVAQAMRQAFSADPQELTNWPRLEPLVPHVETLFELTPTDTTDPSGDLGFLGNSCGVMLYTMARFDAAEPMFRRALAIDEKSFGPEHPNVAIGLNNLASLLQDMNRLAEAEPLFRRALAIDEKSFGPEHPNVATGLNNLALLLDATNRLAEAEPLYRRALAINEKSFGPEHPNVATGLNNLAGLLEATNRLAEAEPLYLRALLIYEIAFGPEHPKVATRLNNLASLLQDMNRLAEAEPLYRRALAINEKTFGPEHPNVAIRLNNLAELLRVTNRLAEAEPLYRRALAIDEKAFGPEHPEVAIDLNNLAQLLQATNRLAEAEPIFRRALEINEKSFGPEHPDVAMCLNNLAALVRIINPADAENHSRRALAILEIQDPLDYSRIANVRSILTRILCDQNRFDEAVGEIAISIELLGKVKSETGFEHPQQTVIIQNFWETLRKAGYTDEEIRRRLVKIDSAFDAIEC